MKKVDIVDKIYEKAGFPRREVAKAVESVFDIMKETLQREDKITISGFGNFLIRNKKARRGRNPQTGSDMEIRSRRILTFKSSPVFRARVNGGGRLLKDLQQGLKDSVNYFSPKNKPVRESWVVFTFLQNLGLKFDEKDLVVPLNDPPDIIFEDAQFEVKEILDPDRKRHLEFKEQFKKSLMAKNPADLIESYTPQDLTPKDIIHLIEKDLSNLGKKYPPEVTSRLDLLFYINLIHHHLKIDKMPDSHGLSKFGWRSISALIGWASLIYYADGRSPGFLQEKNGTLTTRKFV